MYTARRLDRLGDCTLANAEAIRDVRKEQQQLRKDSEANTDRLGEDYGKLYQQSRCPHTWAVVPVTTWTSAHILCASCDLVRCVPPELAEHLKNPKLTQQDLRNLAAGLPPVTTTP